MLNRFLSVSLIITLILCGCCMGTFAEDKYVFGQDKLEYIENEEKFGATILISPDQLDDYAFSYPVIYDASSIKDHDPSLAEYNMSVKADKNNKVVGAYRKYDNGETPVIIFLDGTSNEAKNAALLKYDELNKYNMYCFNSTSKDGNSFNIVNFKSSSALESEYSSVVIDEVLRVFPNTSKVGIVSYSAGGYGANGVCKSATEGNLVTSWVAGYDNVVRDEASFLTFSDYIKSKKIPSLLCLSTDKYRPISLKSQKEAVSNKDDYTSILTYNSNHGKLLNATNLNTETGSTIASDLASFADEHFFGKPTSSSGKAGSSKVSSGKTTTTIDSQLISTQGNLLFKLNTNYKGTVKKAANSIVSGAVTAITSTASSLSKTVASITKASTSSNKASATTSKPKDTVSTTVSSSASASSAKPFWSGATTKITNTLNKLSQIKALTV